MAALRNLLIIVLFFILPAIACANENIFYILHSKTPEQLAETEALLSQLKDRTNKISMIISQAYHVDSKGNVSGFVDKRLMEFSKQHHIKLLALITNNGFDKDVAHQFLSDQAAQTRALDTIVEACERYHYTGVQFDFEGVSIEDKTELTNFYKTAAKQLHQKGFLMSIAVVPAIDNGQPYKSEYLKRRYQNWAGVYDLKALGKIADFVSIMAYDQHGQGTLPGPISGFKWLQTAIKHALKYIPSHKLSLGIPAYSGYWVMTSRPGRVTIQMNQISYREVKALIKAHNLKLNWDAQDKVNYVFFNHNWLYDHLFIEDARAFKAKYTLIQKYKLRGASVFRLGNEDPAIWKTLHHR